MIPSSVVPSSMVIIPRAPAPRGPPSATLVVPSMPILLVVPGTVMMPPFVSATVSSRQPCYVLLVILGSIIVTWIQLTYAKPRFASDSF